MIEVPIQPKSIGSPPGAFRMALNFLKRVGVNKVLDCPCGEGAFARSLLDEGFEVRCCDIEPSQFKLTEVTCDFGDLNNELPYDNDIFDAVVCLNGMQRIWARGRAARELARVTRPGGYVIISFPNNGDIRRRLLFMMTGSVTWNVIGPPHVCLPEAENPASCFRYPMTLANVLSAIKSVGLECHLIQSTHFSKGAILLSPLILGPKIFCSLSPKKYRDFFMLEESSKLDALLGAWLFVVCVKPHTKETEK